MPKTFEKPGLPGYVILGRRAGSNSYVGVVELSFAMDLHDSRTNFFWTGVGRDNIVGAKHQIDGKATAERYRQHFAERNPTIEFTVYDIDSPDLPVVIDWDDWRDGSSPSDRTLSGVKDKFRARNPRFYMPGELDDAAA
jgi:hypothetical protein